MWTYEILGTLSPDPWDLSLYTRNMIEGEATRRNGHVAHVPGPWGRSGCFPAEPYPPPRRIQSSKQGRRVQALWGRFAVEDLEGVVEAEAFAGAVVQRVNIAA